MKATQKPHVKICCIGSKQEAQAAIRAGASALGLVGRMPSGPGVITDEQVLRIARSVPPPIATFLLTSETDVSAIIQHQRRVQTNTLQMVDSLADGTYQEIKEELPGVKLVQVIHVMNEASVEKAIQVAPQVDAILLDSGNPTLAVKELGGTGRVHNWQLSRKIRESINKPVFLAGGLHAENVREAIEVVEPFGLDLCSGVRTGGKLDPYKLEAFFRAIT